MKRFWDSAIPERSGEGYAILLDGKPMHLPGGAVLRVVHARLADAIAAEWQAAGGGKGGEMSYADTPLTRLAGTAQDRVASDRWTTVDAIARYGENDLLCYRAEAPEALVRRQAAAWQPWLDWAAQRYAAPLRVTTGIAPLRQHRGSVAALRDALVSHDIWTLVALGVAVPSIGSLILGLALAERAIDAETAHALGALDEIFQVEQWGEDVAAAARRRAIAADIVLAERMIALTRP